MRCRTLDYAAALGFLVRIADIFVIAASGWFSYAFHFDFAKSEPSEAYWLVIGLQIILASFLFPAFNVYVTWRGKKLASAILYPHTGLEHSLSGFTRYRLSH